MVITLGHHTSVAGAAATSATTPAIDTTGNSLLIVAVAYFNGITPTVSDSFSNTWIPLSSQTDSSTMVTRLYYAIPPDNAHRGVGHTFTLSGTGNTFGPIAACGVNGAATISPFDQQSTATNSAATTIQPGSVTPSEDKEIAFLLNGFENASGFSSVNSSFSNIESKVYVGGVSYGLALSYFIQSTAAALNPTTTGTAPALNNANIATFKISPPAVAGTENSTLGPPPLPTPITDSKGDQFGVPFQHRPSEPVASGNLAVGWAAWFNALYAYVKAAFQNPMTTLGDLIYEDSTPAAARLAGNTSATSKFLNSTGTGTLATAPAWVAITQGITRQSVANPWLGTPATSRATATFYQNLTGKPLFVAASIAILGTLTPLQLLSDAAATPTTVIATCEAFTSVPLTVEISGWVLPGNYYGVSGGTVVNWCENV